MRGSVNTTSVGVITMGEGEGVAGVMGVVGVVGSKTRSAHPVSPWRASEERSL